jgi:hypothetical protein
MTDDQFIKEPASAGGNRLKRCVEHAVKNEPEFAGLQPLLDHLKGNAWDRLDDIMSGKVSYEQ